MKLTPFSHSLMVILLVVIGLSFVIYVCGALFEHMIKKDAEKRAQANIDKQTRTPWNGSDFWPKN